jgi:hypothetical protein
MGGASKVDLILRAEPILGWCFVGLFVAIALGLAYLAYRSSVLARRSQSWPTVEGRLMTSHVTTHGLAFYKLTVTYHYTVDGSSYCSSRIAFGSDLLFGLSAAQHAVESCPVGGAVTVYYNPRNPRQAVLEPGRANNGPYLFEGLACLTGGVIVAVRLLQP